MPHLGLLPRAWRGIRKVVRTLGRQEKIFHKIHNKAMECQESRVKKLLVVIYNYVYLIPLTFSIIYIVWPTLNTYKGPCVSKFAVVPKSHRTDSNFFVRSVVRAPDSCPCSCIVSMFVYLTRSVAAKRRRLEHPGTIPTATWLSDTPCPVLPATLCNVGTSLLHQHNGKRWHTTSSCAVLPALGRWFWCPQSSFWEWSIFWDKSEMRRTS